MDFAGCHGSRTKLHTPPGSRRAVLAAAGIACLLFFLATASAQDEESGPPPEEDESAWYLKGFTDLRYHSRWNDDDEDSDLDQTLSLSFGQTKKRTISGHLSGRIYWDLDGRERPSDSFSSIGDSHGRTYFRLNSAYVDVRPGGFVETVRVGRQWLDEVPEIVWMDGLRLKTDSLEKTLATQIVLFGGATEHFGESSRGGDRVFGGGFEFRPASQTRVGIFYARLRDEYERQTGLQQTDLYNDDLVSIELRQAMFKQTVNFYGNYTNLNGDSRESRARLSYGSEDGTTSLGVNYRMLFSTQETLSTELDPYVSVLRVYQPYKEIGIDFSQDFTDVVGMQGGAQIRLLDHDADEGVFNREFERYYLSGLLKELPFEGSQITVTGDLYDAYGDRFWVMEGSFEQKVYDDLKVTVGSGYALYHENRFTFEERSHVRTGFVRVNYEVAKDLDALFGYEAERGDEDTAHMVEAGLRFRF